MGSSDRTKLLRRNQDLEEGLLEVAVVLRRLGYGLGDSPLLSAEILEELSPRQRQVSLSILKFHSVETVADELAISPHTVRNHLRMIYQRLGVRSRAEFIAKLRASE